MRINGYGNDTAATVLANEGVQQSGCRHRADVE